MTCDLPPRQCLDWHILGRLRDAAESPGTPGQYRARCPAHDDQHASLAVAIGEHQRVIWHCFAGCDPLRVRAELARRDISYACLPLSRTDDQRLADAMDATLTRPDLDHAAARLLAHAQHEGLGRLPRAPLLERIAAQVQVSRAQAFRARKSGLHPQPQYVAGERRNGQVPQVRAL